MLFRSIPPTPITEDSRVPARGHQELRGLPRRYRDDERDQYGEARDGVSALSLGRHRDQLSDDSRYDDEGMYGRYNGSDQPTERVPSRNGLHAHVRTGSTASLSLSRNPSPLPENSPTSVDGGRPGYRRTDSVPFSDGPPSASSRGPAAKVVSRPSISASNPQAAFVKIKIFHRRTDDLIAIRVNPQVSHMQLMEKVRERLGDDIQTVSYRSSVSGAFADLRDDHALRGWLDSADKHVLYAL